MYLSGFNMMEGIWGNDGRTNNDRGKDVVPGYILVDYTYNTFFW